MPLPSLLEQYLVMLCLSCPRPTQLGQARGTLLLLFQPTKAVVGWKKTTDLSRQCGILLLAVLLPVHIGSPSISKPKVLDIAQGGRT